MSKICGFYFLWQDGKMKRKDCGIRETDMESCHHIWWLWKEISRSFYDMMESRTDKVASGSRTLEVEDAVTVLRETIRTKQIEPLVWAFFFGILQIAKY